MKPGTTAAIASLLAASDTDLTWLPAWRIRELIGRREISPIEVTEHFLGRIEALDPHLHAFRMVDPENAREQARHAENAVLAGRPLGPLHGIPVALKEHIAVKGLAWKDLLNDRSGIADRDGIEAERLRNAGAVVVGTTVGGLTSYEFGDSERQPLNPWDTDRVCGDSSSGSACAIASAMVPLAIAVDGLGSTRLPAAYCGLIGLLPTRGRLPSIDWQEMNTRLLSTVGPLSRDVRDAATVLSLLAGPDGRDLACSPDSPPDYLHGLDDGARGIRLVWTADFGYAAAYSEKESLRVIRTAREAASRFEAAGAEIEETGAIFEDPYWVGNMIMVSDPGLAIYRKIGSEDVVRARETRGRMWDIFNRVLGNRHFIISPTAQHIAPTRQFWAERWAMPIDWESPGQMAAYTAHTAAANVLGWPAMSVPAGLVDGMPIGLQIIGRPNSEPQMLRLAQALGSTT
jgi:aspartyl-tRNA(Asn)/glutamyl-tRNA(Gln) amidotransferase subunit A